LATLYGAAFHFIVGGGTRRLALYLMAGWLGFAVGQLLGGAFNVTLLSIGTIHMVAASLGALVALLLARLLAK
jgi:uncharacterized membrane protein YeaQ/YmgE (transglycosylase-associated protein family)